jgi:ABC-2 type transport system ATP-binding protein
MSDAAGGSTTTDDRLPDGAVQGANLSYRYGDRIALDRVSVSVSRGEIFGVLGPNGGGKTTLFRILSTLVDPDEGTLAIAGFHLPSEKRLARPLLGIVFQKPALDGKLTVEENLRHHGMLYGLSGRLLKDAVDRSVKRLGIADRRHDRGEDLSGGLQRRVELAKSLMTEPRILILDEPSTGLDPGARHDLWRYLAQLRAEDGTTILLTTHLMDEADRCDRIAILDGGRTVAMGTPDELKHRIGGDVITIRSRRPADAAVTVERVTGQKVSRVGDLIRLEHANAHVWVRQLFEVLADDVVGISLAKPTLEDVFVRETGHRFWNKE